MNPITATIAPYALIAGAVVVGLGLATIGYQHVRIGHLKTKLDADKTTISNYASANQSNVAAIKSLQDANDAWKARGLDVQKSADAVANLTLTNARLQDSLHAALNNREKIYVAQPNARKWANTGMPASIADAIWLRPAADHAHANR